MSYLANMFSWPQEPEARAEAIRIRLEVFVHEQGVPESEELDATDPKALHVLVRDGAGAAVATARLYNDGEFTGRIGRMAVLKEHRGTGAGSAAMRLMLQAAWDLGWDRIVLDAQDQAIPFYERHGFTVCGPPHLDCGIPHHLMAIEGRALQRRVSSG